ncbi:MAG: hypothetical protein QM621_10290 [Aeromicrobium sp.]|uniref:hypothetical protein n=1 Tax=Aeromicrobium sp. TaxID=1871063 RepID=UPI0039E71B4D
MLAEGLLRRPGSVVDVPSNADAARALGWTVYAYQRMLDSVCEAFAARGVPGLRGVAGKPQTYRRQHLVDHVVSTGVITSADLHLL